jgi:hypothetical protein
MRSEIYAHQRFQLCGKISLRIALQCFFTVRHFFNKFLVALVTKIYIATCYVTAAALGACLLLLNVM